MVGLKHCIPSWLWLVIVDSGCLLAVEGGSKSAFISALYQASQWLRLAPRQHSCSTSAQVWALYAELLLLVAWTGTAPGAHLLLSNASSPCMHRYIHPQPWHALVQELTVLTFIGIHPQLGCLPDTFLLLRGAGPMVTLPKAWTVVVTKLGM